MGDRLRVAVGIMGNGAALLLYAAPMITFTRVLRKKNTEDFSCVPYIVALLNCFLYAWYGLPIVSRGWENFTVVSINAIGVLLELSFISIYLRFAPANAKKKVGILTALVILICCATAISSALAIHDHPHRKIFVGSMGVIASVAMYTSPLVVVKQVIQTKSVKFMPFYLSLFTFLSSTLWMTYGFISHDYFLGSPNMIGSPLGLLQLLLYFKYRKHYTMDVPSSSDVEKNSEKIKQEMLSHAEDNNDNAKDQLQLVLSEETKGKM
ncbi:bidirectional sugar transporter SWEET3b-like [Coffea arabica]|uniref:Bidirectional sugar transporter SWEET n=1 Tax=Coffea arabica TaxID=13443 RepID=A0ABM4W5Q5_COFAR